MCIVPSSRSDTSPLVGDRTPEGLCFTEVDVVQRLRRAKGWSQEEFAERAGVNRTYVSGMERGIRNPAITVVEKLVTALEATVGELAE